MGRFGGYIIAIGLAIVIGVVVFRSMETPPPASTGPIQATTQETTNIFVAAKPISVGTTISADMLAIQPWPKNLVLGGFIKSDDGPNKIIGSVARSAFQQQEPIVEPKLANPNDPNFLAGDLPKGMRVVTITTNEAEGVAGFLFPGDHVDVMLTHDVDGAKYPSALGGHWNEKSPVTEALLNNVKVLAVDQRASGAQSTDKDGKLIIPRSVSLMVSSTDAQRLRLGERVGTLTLALRALVDRDASDPLTATSINDISRYKLKLISGGGVTVYRGANKDGAAATQPYGATVLTPATPVQGVNQ